MTTGTLTLAEFILARIAEEATEAVAASVDQWGYRVGSYEGLEWTSLALSPERDTTAAQDQFIARHDPARVLAECDAKRRIVDLHGMSYADAADETWARNGRCDTCRDAVPCPTLRLLALPYADHDQYDPSWRP